MPQAEMIPGATSLVVRSRRLIESCVLLLVAAITVHTWLVAGLAAPIVVNGESMLPTLLPGERLLVDRAAFYFVLPRRWQLVVFRCPEDASTYCVKRIVGLPGETVEIRSGRLWIDGRPAAPGDEQPYTFAPIGQPAQYRLAADEYFLLGDNPNVSVDSRTWQPPGINPKSFIGSPLWPDKWRAKRPRKTTRAQVGYPARRTKNRPADFEVRLPGAARYQGARLVAPHWVSIAVPPLAAIRYIRKPDILTFDSNASLSAP